MTTATLSQTMVAIGEPAKNIILSNGVVRRMNYEEILVQFEKMIKQHARIFMSKFDRGQYEKEDLIQDLKEAAWIAFKEYDEKHAFSTILVNKMKKVTGNLSQKITRKKREHFAVSMNSTVGGNEDLKLEDMFSIDDYTAENMGASEMMTLIKANIKDERELEELACVLDPKEFSVADLAKKRGCSRQAANQRVGKTRAKLQDLLIQNSFVIA